MPREIAGKIFTPPEEVPESQRLTPEELADARAQFAAFNAHRPPQPAEHEPKTEANRRMWDDLGGTEYEDWTYPGDDRPRRGDTA
ncbi:hypothetical protein ACTD5D_21485 [Nocardia takedensis]|uniref:hypothetical protein n=1 Tax=Nocardia takedensis TaxID=259390 RepID=UPI003F76B9AB